MNAGSPPATTYYSFEVDGEPIPQGSMRSPKAGVVLHSNAKLAGWRNTVSGEARKAYSGKPWDGPVLVALTFIVKPPLHNRELYASKKPDLDKLIRACLDALDGIVYVNDSRVVRIEAEKVYAGGGMEPGVTVEVWLR